MDPVVVYVPMCIQNGLENPALKASEEPNVRTGGHPPQLNSIGSYGSKYCFVMIIGVKQFANLKVTYFCRM
jgi:hypothetical protein